MSNISAKYLDKQIITPDICSLTSSASEIFT